MGAGDRWHELGPVKDGDPIISPAILHLMQGQGGAEHSDLPREAGREAASLPQSTPDGGPKNEDILANLLRAIENTQIAASFANLAPPAQTEEIAEDSCTHLQEPAAKADADACFEAAPGGDAESDEAVTDLLRALHETEITATLESIERAEYAERISSACAQPSENAEAAFTTSKEPVADADEESSKMASAGKEESAEAASILERPVFRARPNTLKQRDRHPKRMARRRNSNRRRPKNLPSVAESIPATPFAAADAQTAEPIAAIPGPAIEEPRPVAVEPKTEGTATTAEPAKPHTFTFAPAVPDPSIAIEPEPTKIIEPLELAEPAEPLPAVAATIAAEPEQPSTAEPELTDDTLILPAAGDGGATKTRVRVRFGTGIGSFAATGDLINGGLDRAEMHLENWFQKWLGPPDPRRNARVENPPLVAYHWIADVSQALKIGDISAGGLHLITKDRWSEGNIVSMTLQRTDREKGSPDSWIAVDFLVMRWCEDGMAGAFMAATPGLTYTVAGRAGNCADKKTLVRFVDRLADAAAGQLAVRK